MNYLRQVCLHLVLMPFLTYLYKNLVNTLIGISTRCAFTFSHEDFVFHINSELLISVNFPRMIPGKFDRSARGLFIRF